MKWVEIIELRTADSRRELLESKLLKLINQAEKEMKTKAFRSYRRAVVDTDFSIHLFHDSKKVEKCGSPLGLRIASALKAFGLVNHRVWVEISGRQSVTFGSFPASKV